jgi:hypothetical protein
LGICILSNDVRWKHPKTSINAQRKPCYHNRAWNVSCSTSPTIPHLTRVTSYFSRYALEEVYLKDERFAKFINKDLLEKYYPVGGVRIEDDILVTEDGYENLTTAPKGEEALKIINGGQKEGKLGLFNPKRWLL